MNKKKSLWSWFKDKKKYHRILASRRLWLKNQKRYEKRSRQIGKGVLSYAVSHGKKIWQILRKMDLDSGRRPIELGDIGLSKELVESVKSLIIKYNDSLKERKFKSGYNIAAIESVTIGKDGKVRIQTN